MVRIPPFSRHMPTQLLFDRCLAAVVVCSLAAGPVAAQTVAKPSVSNSHLWKLQPTFVTEEEFDNNVFLLPDLKKAKLVAGAPAGTHYADMVSANDAITTLRAQLSLDGPGVAGKRIKIVPEVGYDFYLRNAERRTASYGVTVAQKTARGGLLRLKAAMQPQTFFKNYLLDAIDLDGSGSISTAEKLYGPAKQGETTVESDYTLRLRKESAESMVRASLRIGGGWYSRSYNAGFTSRDLKGPTASGKLLLSIAQHSTLDLGYAFASLAAPRMLNVMLLDEPQFGRDFNGNGTATDLAARAVEMVDRSRTEQELSASFDIDFGTNDLALDYARRTRSFSSTQPYDLANNGRRDTRNEFGGTLRHDITSGLRLRAAAQRGAQTLNVANTVAATGDVADYTRLRTSIGLEYRF